MPKAKSIKKFITESEQELAARYFALSNVCMLEQAGSDLVQGFYRANEAMQMECGASLREELNDWYDLIEKGDAYCYDTWQQVREKYIK
jgi:hypothetical protein